MVKYIIRLDDLALNVDKTNWIKMFDLLKNNGIKPILGIIPKNEDVSLMAKTKSLEVGEDLLKKFALDSVVALHGYDHCYITKEAGIVPMNNNSEFAGVCYDEQKNKILKGLKILSEVNIFPTIWMAPSHSFDRVTLDVLRKHTSIRVITDGVAFKPFRREGFLWIPQQLWSPKFRLFGVWTICYHPSSMSKKDFEKLEFFIESNLHKIELNPEKIIRNSKWREENYLDSIFSCYFFLKRYLIKMVR